MARFSAQLRLPVDTREGRTTEKQLGERLSTSIQAVHLAVTYCGPAGLTAQATDRGEPTDQKLVLSWGHRDKGSDVMTLLLELQSDEAMACGAPLTQRSFSALLETLQKALPGVEVMERSDH